MGPVDHGRDRRRRPGCRQTGAHPRPPAALHATGTPAADAVLVGDSPETNIAAAQAAGVPTAWLNRSGRPWPEALRPPDQTIRQLTDLL
ncbi:MAG: HAD family hydrolase [Dehalococcoidia bacterium]|nr:HAD family hydrolase [Dehalococcoidia bacterium]